MGWLRRLFHRGEPKVDPTREYLPYNHNFTQGRVPVPREHASVIANGPERPLDAPFEGSFPERPAATERTPGPSGHSGLIVEGERAVDVSNSIAAKDTTILSESTVDVDVVSQDKQSHGIDKTTIEENAIEPSQSHNSVPQIIFSRHSTFPQPVEPPQPKHEDMEFKSDRRRPRAYSQISSRSSSRASSRASVHTEASSENGEILPSKVSCALHITLDDRELVHPEKQEIEWMKASAFNVLSKAAEDCLRSDRGLQNIDLHLPSFYLRNGFCRVMGRRHHMEPRKLENDLQIVEVLVIAICGFIHDHPYEPFSLLINWHYSTLCIKEVPGKPYNEVIRNEIYRKMERNYQSKYYIPRTDLIGIISPETSRRIIDEDTSISEEDKASLATAVPFKAEKLQAVCVYVQLPMLALQCLMAKGFDDDHRPRDKSDCPQAPARDWNVNFGDFLEKQASFFAYKFPAPMDGKDYDDIASDVIVPVSYPNQEKVLGEGSFSIVYKVKIDPVHHYFSEDKTQLFALKEFKERKKETKEESTFNRELEMLKSLKNFPHPHIVTHLFTWTQDEKFYMLFDMARFNLRQYMDIQPADSPATNSPTGSFVHMRRDESVRRPVLEASFVVWLFRQLKGIGDAVKHIHQLMGDAVKLPSRSHRERDGVHVRATGFHHDIKPENILVFIGGGDQYGTLKIGDFGSGKMQTLRSGTQPRSHFANASLGTSTYEGPDFYLNGKASRPYDLWSLGCVFLEILLWCFMPGEGGAGNFASDRYETLHDQPNITTDCFWYSVNVEGPKQALLKDAVTQRLKTLRETHCRGRRAFTRLLKLIDRMFEPEPIDRITATELTSDLDAILKQVQIDLQSKPDCYIKATFDELPESSVPIPGTPTTVATRRPSLRELNTGTFGETLSPLDAHNSPGPVRRRSESIGREGVAPATSNIGGHLSQPTTTQRDDGLTDPLESAPRTPKDESIVRPWDPKDVFGPGKARG